MCVSDGGVRSLHSLLRSASNDFFWCNFNIFTSHLSFMNNNKMHGWLAARVNWRNVTFHIQECINAEFTLMDGVSQIKTTHTQKY